ncbi:MAG: hypothetical protein KGN16_14510 [Burkholderiales bacterium]|nr:hypothetical protein [Burkholderiales bacterium]
MITIRQYLAFLTFLAVCMVGLIPIYRWWRKTEDAADADARKARLAQLERQSREQARTREISEEQQYLAAEIRELRKAMGLTDEGTATAQPSPAEAGARAAELPAEQTPQDPTESLLDEALGPALAPNGDGSVEEEQTPQGPAFRRGTIPKPDDPKVTIFETEETRSKTRLVADRGIPHHPDSWAFSVHFPPFESMANWPRPHAFGNPGYEWTKWVPFTEIPADDPERALDELEAWFLRLATGEEKPTGGRLTKSCADWEDYEEDPKTRGWRVLWWEPRDE